jgi:hydrogenase maturation protease
VSDPGNRRTLVIGVGNPYRRDDGVGLDVARSIRAEGIPGVEVVEQSGEGAALLEAWQNSSMVILIDAVSSGAPPGTIRRFELPDDTMPLQFFHYSTHAFSVAEAIELARALDLLPSRLIVYGIEGSDFAPGEGLSADVKPSAEEVTTQIRTELRSQREHAIQGTD